MEPRTQAEMDATDAAYEKLVAEELLNPPPEVDDPPYVPLPTKEGQVVATMTPEKGIGHARPSRGTEPITLAGPRPSNS